MEPIITELKCLKANKEWITVYNSDKPESSPYYYAYNYILNILNKVQGKGSLTASNMFMQGHKHMCENGIIIEIIKVESHRHCSVLMCTQYVPKTNGFRYLIYGIYRPGYEDYGIGTSLSNVANDHFVPNKEIKMYID